MGYVSFIPNSKCTCSYSGHVKPRFRVVLLLRKNKNYSNIAQKNKAETMYTNSRQSFLRRFRPLVAVPQ